MKPRLKPLAVLIGVFLLGGVAGAGASRAYMLYEFRTRFRGPPSEVRTNLRLEAMRRQLGLSAEQTTKIEAIFHETDSQLEGIMKPCRDGLDSLRERTDARILEVLDKDQQARYREHIERHKRMPPGPFPPPPGMMPGPPPPP
jgi:hypothetical protein